MSVQVPCRAPGLASWSFSFASFIHDDPIRGWDPQDSTAHLSSQVRRAKNKHELTQHKPRSQTRTSNSLPLLASSGFHESQVYCTTYYSLLYSTLLYSVLYSRLDSIRYSMVYSLSLDHAAYHTLCYTLYYIPYYTRPDHTMAHRAILYLYRSIILQHDATAHDTTLSYENI